MIIRLTIDNMNFDSMHSFLAESSGKQENPKLMKNSPGLAVDGPQSI